PAALSPPSWLPGLARSDTDKPSPKQGRSDSNAQPLVLETSALPIELHPCEQWSVPWSVAGEEKPRSQWTKSRTLLVLSSRPPATHYFFRDSLCAVCFRSLRQNFFSSSR